MPLLGDIVIDAVPESDLRLADFPAQIDLFTAQQRGEIKQADVQGSIEALTKAGIDLDRKVLAEMAVADAQGFAGLVEKAKAQLASA